MTTTAQTSSNFSVELSSTTEFGALKFDEDARILLMGSLIAPSVEIEESKRKPIDIIAVVDVSGSMSGRLSLVKESLFFMLTQLTNFDRFGIVSYHTEVKVEFALDVMTNENKEKVQIIINQLRPLSSTNLSGGLFQGIDEMINRNKKSEISSVILFTDGQANVGITDKDLLVQSLKEKFQKCIVGGLGGCSVFSFGFGSDHDEKLLRGIADNADGMYYFMEKTDDIPNAFADVLGGLLSVAGQNIQIRIVPKHGAIINKILTKYPFTENPDGTVLVKLSDIYGDERRDIICNVSVPKIDAPQQKQDLVEFSLEYFNVLTSRLETASSTVSVERTVHYTNAAPNLNLDRERNRYETAEALQNARVSADALKFNESNSILKSTIEKLRTSVSCEDIQTKECIQDLSAALSDMLSKEHYTQVGSKRMASNEQKYSKQRTCSSTTVDSPSFRSPGKTKMKQSLTTFQMTSPKISHTYTPNPGFVSPTSPRNSRISLVPLIHSPDAPNSDTHTNESQ